MIGTERRPRPSGRDADLRTADRTASATISVPTTAAPSDDRSDERVDDEGRETSPDPSDPTSRTAAPAVLRSSVATMGTGAAGTAGRPASR